MATGDTPEEESTPDSVTVAVALVAEVHGYNQNTGEFVV